MKKYGKGKRDYSDQERDSYGKFANTQSVDRTTYVKNYNKDYYKANKDKILKRIKERQKNKVSSME